MAEHLVIGGDGLIGQAVIALLRAKGESVWATTRRSETAGRSRYLLDLRKVEPSWRPDRCFNTVFLCAGQNPKQCLQDPVGSHIVNVTSPFIIAKTLADQGSFVVKLSSNAVFDGSMPYQSAHGKHSPHWLYGHQHSELDCAVLSLAGRAAVVRFSKVVAQTVPIFDGWVDALMNGRTIRPLSDLNMAPLSLPFIVDLIVRVGLARRSGVFQASGARDVSYADAARVVVRQLGLSESLVRAATIEEMRLNLGWQPRHTTLDMTETGQCFGLAAQTIDEALNGITATIATVG